jgi:hypothetical protein
MASSLPKRTRAEGAFLTIDLAAGPASGCKDLVGWFGACYDAYLNIACFSGTVHSRLQHATRPRIRFHSASPLIFRSSKSLEN